MVKISNKRRFLVILILSSIVFATCIQVSFISLLNNDSSLIQPIKKENKPKTNGILTDIYIDDSPTSNERWKDKIGEPWLTGSGKKNDPYVIRDITIDAKGTYIGIYIKNSNNVSFVIQNVTILNPSNAGIKLEQCKNGTINDNYILNPSPGEFTIPPAGVYLEKNCSYITIQGNRFDDMEFGIKFYDNCSKNIIKDNILDDYEYGLYLESRCNNNTIINNTIRYNNYGVVISDESKYNNITENLISYNERVGLALSTSDKNRIYGNNTISNNRQGIYLSSSDNNTISGNNLISFNTEDGIFLYSSSGNNISENEIYDNSQVGLYIFETGGESRYNIIFKNFFKRNQIHAKDDPLSNNKWFFNETYLHLGNYWDDFTDMGALAKDLNDDGIGDRNYTFYGGVDHFPIWNDGIEGGVIKVIGNNNESDWEWASKRFWCSGSGYPWDPYIIEPNFFWPDGKIESPNGKSPISIINSTDWDNQFIIQGLTLSQSSRSYTAGIYLNNVTNGLIRNNNCSFNVNGIYLNNTSNIKILRNIANYNSFAGIFLNGSSNWNIINTTTCAGNAQYGIYLVDDCDWNNISLNTFKENDQRGAYITTADCRNNTFYINTFRDNNGPNAVDDGRNTWYFNGIGNFWDDYPGDDEDDDGIGDTPYIINVGPPLIQDRYPIWDDKLDGKPIYIDAMATGPWAHNWTWAKRRLYISGNGTKEDPITIRDITFYAYKADAGMPKSCIYINNSKVEYFAIINCTLKLVGTGVTRAAGITLENSERGRIINNTIIADQDGDYGIYLYDRCKGNYIRGNVIGQDAINSNFTYGILLFAWGQNNIITENEIYSCYIGIHLNLSCIANTINFSIVKNNYYCGIYINASSKYNKILNNTIIDNGNGTIVDGGSQSNEFRANLIKDNEKYGALLWEKTHGYGGTRWNYFRLNNFTDNGLIRPNGKNALDNGTYTIWDDGMKGNFWSDYDDIWGAKAQDKDDDGIGDIDYMIYNLTGDWIRNDTRPIWDDGHNGSLILIDGNDWWGPRGWYSARTKSWCSGDGTRKNPFVIKGINPTIFTNSSITIMNSDVPFVIKGCDLHDVVDNGPPNYTAGIKLINVWNGTILKNEIHENNDHGILLNACKYITITRNTIYNNGDDGILISGGSNNISIIDNIIDTNQVNGIHIDKDCQKNWISMNTINFTVEAGILFEECGNNTIINNDVLDNKFGISIIHSDDNDIILNDINNSLLHGISINSVSDDNTMKDNTIYNNGGDGIHLGGCEDNRITKNLILSNLDRGIYIKSSSNTNIIRNTIDDNFIGIFLDYSSENIIIKNDITNNIAYGIQLFGLFACTNNEIWDNRFITNGIHGFDDGTNNQWDNGIIGNYWDDYEGVDANDDGKGDQSYKKITGGAKSEDKVPKWWDAPTLTVFEPVNYTTTFGQGIPSYRVRITEGYGHYFWYELRYDGTTLTSPYKLLAGIPNEELKSEGDPVLSNLWKQIPLGKTVTIRFFVNDSQGYYAPKDAIVLKNVTLDGGGAAPPVADDDDSTADAGDDAGEEGLPWWLQAIFTGMISASAGLVIKISYSAHKRRKELYRKISDNLDRIDNIEKFLQDRLGTEDWDKLKESLEKYQKNEISPKQLVKQSKKSVGKKFLHLFVKPKPKKKKK